MNTEKKIDAVAKLHDAVNAYIDCGTHKNRMAMITALGASERAATVAKDGGEVVDIDKMYATRGEVFKSASAGDLLGAMRVIEQHALSAHRGSGIAGMCRDVIAALAATPKPEASAATQQAGILPEGVRLESFREHGNNRWCVVVKHPFGTSWLRMSDPRDVKLAELLAAPISEDTGNGRTNAGDETGGAVRRFGFDCTKTPPEIIPATNGAFVWYDDYAALRRLIVAQMHNKQPAAPSGSIGELPPLPGARGLALTIPNKQRVVECIWTGPISDRKESLYSADQMHEYAQACIAADRAARTPASVGGLCIPGAILASKDTHQLWTRWSDRYAILATPEELAKELADCEAQAVLELEQCGKPGWWASKVEKIKEGIATYDTRASHMEAAPRNAGVVGYIDPISITNLKNGVSTKEWMWAKHDAGLIPVTAPAAPDTRDAALEEAAALSEGMNSHGQFIADAIRAMKSKGQV